MECTPALCTPALRFVHRPRFRAVVLSAAGLLVGMPVAFAQVPAPPVVADTPTTARPIETTTERIVHHDAGSRIEELRVGGQTRSIEVETNSRLPGYRVQPIDPAQSPDHKNSAGKSSWRVLSF